MNGRLWSYATVGKYGREHNKACVCNDCLRAMTLHNVQAGNQDCVCWDCIATRSQLAVIEETNERGRKFRMDGIAQDIREREGSVSTINICDRPECGSMTKSNVMGAVEFYTGEVNGERTYGHLCPACAGELAVWWEAAVGEREKAYSKPWSRPKAADDPARLTSAQLMNLAIKRGREELEQS